jgi:hypothetical protein
MVKNLSKFINIFTSKKLKSILVVILVASIGTYLLVGSHAASPYSSITADSGVLSDGAIKQTCSGSADGNCVLFNGSTTTNSPVLQGLNDIGGWNSSFATTFTNAGIKGDRIAFLLENGTNAQYETQATDQSYGIDTLMANLDVSNSVSLSCKAMPNNCVTPSAYANWAYSVIKLSPSLKYWDVMNEAYYKGYSNGVFAADPVDYGADYMALYNMVEGKDSGIAAIPGQVLMFNDFGDYCYTNGVTEPNNSCTEPGNYFSADATGGGWLHDAVAANNGLAAAIASEALSVHPYGDADKPTTQAMWDNDGQDENSPYSVGTPNPYNQGSACSTGCDDEIIAKEYLGSIPPIYVTEYGVQDTGIATPDCSTGQGEEAYQLTEAGNVFLSDPNIKGIWWYSALDTDGPYGIMNGTPPNVSARPAFTALVQEENGKSNNTPSCNG